MHDLPQSRHWNYVHNGYAGTDSAVIDPNIAAEVLRRDDGETHEPVENDSLTGVKYGLIFSLAIWAFLLSLGVAIFR